MNLRIFLLMILVILSLSTVNAQFDKKLTFSGYGGYVIPGGDKIDPDSIPNIFPNFKTGLQLGIGGQYNLNHNVSVGLTLGSTIAFNYKDPIPLNSSVTVGDGKDDSYFFITAIGLDFRYKFLHQRAFNPYVLGEFNFNLYNGQVEPHYSYLNQTKGYVYYDPNIQDKYTILRYNSRKIESSLAFGIVGGAGFDFKLSNTFVLFMQGAYNIKFTKGNETMKENIRFFNIQAGLRFSLFKSKSLL